MKSEAYTEVDFLEDLKEANDQIITINFQMPWFLMSGVGMVYIVTAPSIAFKGYLSKFEPVGMHCEELPATMTVHMSHEEYITRGLK